MTTDHISRRSVIAWIDSELAESQDSTLPFDESKWQLQAQRALTKMALFVRSPEGEQ